MTSRTPIVCYDDNPDYGGHQVMAGLAIEALASSRHWKPVFFYNPRNERLFQTLEKIRKDTGNLELHPAPFTTRKFQGVRSRFQTGSIRWLRHLFAEQSPDLILVIQGEIEDSALALCAAQPLPVPCISYIPVPHRMALMGAKLGAVRDALNAWLFKKPDGWITISRSMKTLLEERGASAPIEVVPNGIDMERFQTLEKQACRAALRLPQDKTLIGSIGRIEFNQKQQDFLVRTFSRLRQGCSGQANFGNNDGSLHLVITGDGPDREKLEALISELGLAQQITLLPWQADSALVYNALDLLIIPSRFEGVPLVLLEALACGVPVIGSARDGMKDVLPASWTFEPENGDALAKCFEQVSTVWKTEMPALQKQIRTEYTVETFQQNFEAALRRFLIIGR